MCISTKLGSEVYILSFNSCVKFLAKIFIHCWKIKKVAAVTFCTHPVQGTAIHDGLLHPHLRHYSSAAPAVRRLPSAVCTTTAALDVQSPVLFCGWLGGLELANTLDQCLWNSLPVALRDRDVSLVQFKRLLKTLWFVQGCSA